jgi:asparagine N-glycosylation enzyme membrane subunit Stt3
MDEEKEIKERKEKIKNFFLKKQIWVLVILLLILIIGFYIRSLPMYPRINHVPSVFEFYFQNPGGNPGLWDITTNTWTLGPDLDPFLFLRTAKTIVSTGFIPEIDYFRNVPLGYDTSGETKLLPYLIVITYDFIKIFNPEITVDFAGVFFPVILFLLTIISFFLFVREIFIRETKESVIKANLIAIISTAFMTIIPVFLSRTIAGIPEKESAGFFFMFLAFYFFLRSWKIKDLKYSISFAVLSGITTGLMGLIWGGVVYIFVTIALTNLLMLLIGKNKKKDFLIYTLWLISTLITLLVFTDKYSFMGLLTSTNYLITSVTFFILLIDFILWNTSVKKLERFNKYNLPKNIISIIIAIVIGLLGIILIFGPGFIINKTNDFIETFITPVTGRWGVTVAENAQPYYSQWASNFGPMIKNIPIFFWLFFIGSVLLFKEMLSEMKNKDKIILIFLYILFFFGLVFSRYAPHPNTFDGEGTLSLFVYFGSALLFISALVYYHIKYKKVGKEAFGNIEYEYLLLFSLFILALFTARSAVRLIMVLGPIAPIFVGYLSVTSIDSFRKTKDETKKILLGSWSVILIILLLFSGYVFFNSIKSEAYSYVPSVYSQQWQKAMSWVRTETPKDAVFAHWWDYGYWVQSMGNRATVVDGGNAIVYWDYLVGRLVLTGDNQQDALNFLYTHNTTHLLIDSSDIGKYTAFSSIGSNKIIKENNEIDWDRESWIGSFVLNEKGTVETKNETKYLYGGGQYDGVLVDEDLVIKENNSEILIPRSQAGVKGIIVPMQNSGNATNIMQPAIIAIYNGEVYNIKLRYLQIEGEKIIDFKSGIEGCVFIIPSINVNTEGQVSQNPLGAAMYLSPRLMRGMFSQLYLLNDPFRNFTAFKITHTEPSYIVDFLNKQGMKLPDFIYYQGVQGPIKIWEIKYTGNEKIKQEYLDKDYTKYIDWAL